MIELFNPWSLTFKGSHDDLDELDEVIGATNSIQIIWEYGLPKALLINSANGQHKVSLNDTIHCDRRGIITIQRKGTMY